MFLRDGCSLANFGASTLKQKFLISFDLLPQTTQSEYSVFNANSPFFFIWFGPPQTDGGYKQKKKNNNNNNNNNNKNKKEKNKEKQNDTERPKSIWVCKSNITSAYHVQHVVCHEVRRDSSAFNFDRVDIAFISLVETIHRWWKMKMETEVETALLA